MNSPFHNWVGSIVQQLGWQVDDLPDGETVIVKAQCHLGTMSLRIESLGPLSWPGTSHQGIQVVEFGAMLTPLMPSSMPPNAFSPLAHHALSQNEHGLGHWSLVETADESQFCLMGRVKFLGASMTPDHFIMALLELFSLRRRLDEWMQAAHRANQ